MRDTKEECPFEVRPTDSVSESVCVLWVDSRRIDADTVITEGTTLESFMPLAPKGDALTRGFGSYTLTSVAGKDSAGWIGYYFAKPKTASQKRTAYRSVTKSVPVSWPAWLRNLYGGMASRTIDTETGSDAAGATSNTVTRLEFVDRYELIPGGQIMTEVIEEEFLSATPFTDLDTEVPVPTSVRYNYKGASLSIECLHDDVFVPELTTGFMRESDFGMPGAQDLPEGQFFPRTNFIGWSLYTLSDTQQLIDGVYKRTTVRITKLPPLPEPLRF